MLTILLIALALYIFWLLFRNGPAFAERLPDHKRNWVGPTANQEEWRGYCADVFQPFSSRTTFYAIAYFANYIAVANAISWSIVYEGNYPVMMSRFGSYFIVSTHDAMLVAGFVSLAFFIINWQLAMHCASLLSQYLVRILIDGGKPKITNRKTKNNKQPSQN